MTAVTVYNTETGMCVRVRVVAKERANRFTPRVFCMCVCVVVRQLGKQNIQQNVRISDTGYGDSVRRLAWPNKHLPVEVVALLGSKNMAP